MVARSLGFGVAFASMDEQQRNRLFSAGALLLVLFGGYSLSSSYAGATDEQVAAVMAKRVTRANQQSKVLARGKRFGNTPEHFAFELAGDLKRFALREVTTDELGKPNAWRLLVDKSDPEKLSTGRTYAGDGISVKASTTKVRYRRHGVTVKSVHAVAIVKNTSQTPLAYRIALEPNTSAKCEVRGARRHNTIALMPGESADLVVCAGRSGVVILSAEVMEVTAIGYYYLSMLPPAATDLGPIRGGSHFGPSGANQCDGVPAVKYSRALRRGDIKWRDIVDFYSRHNCSRLQMPEGYRWTGEGREILPSLGKTFAGE